MCTPFSGIGPTPPRALVGERRKDPHSPPTPAPGRNRDGRRPRFQRARHPHRKPARSAKEIPEQTFCGSKARRSQRGPDPGVGAQTCPARARPRTGSAPPGAPSQAKPARLTHPGSRKGCVCAGGCVSAGGAGQGPGTHLREEVVHRGARSALAGAGSRKSGPGTPGRVAARPAAPRGHRRAPGALLQVGPFCSSGPRSLTHPSRGQPFVSASSEFLTSGRCARKLRGTAAGTCFPLPEEPASAPSPPLPSQRAPAGHKASPRRSPRAAAPR